MPNKNNDLKKKAPKRSSISDRLKAQSKYQGEKKSIFTVGAIFGMAGVAIMILGYFLLFQDSSQPAAKKETSSQESEKLEYDEPFLERVYVLHRQGKWKLSKPSESSLEVEFLPAKKKVILENKLHYVQQVWVDIYKNKLDFVRRPYKMLKPGKKVEFALIDWGKAAFVNVYSWNGSSVHQFYHPPKTQKEKKEQDQKGRPRLINESNRMTLKNGCSYMGEITEGKPHGRGVSYHRGGQKKYAGDWKEGEFHGLGSYYNRYGRLLYIGHYEEGKRHGRGISYFDNGKKDYSGKWRKDLPHGQGTSYYKSGKKKYVGKWELGQKKGFGVAYREDGSRAYEGYWKDGNRHGQGVLFTFKETKIYDGEWSQGRRHGIGKLYYNNGQLAYSGDWKWGERHGHGTLFNKKGKKLYEGDFKDDEFHGYGKAFYPKSSQVYFKGDWKKGLFYGQGTTFWKNGNKSYKGEFQRGLRHGKGVWRSKTGSQRYKGSWERDQFIKVIPPEYESRAVISMKDGRKLEGKILSQSPNQVEIKMKYGTLPIDRKEIKEIKIKKIKIEKDPVKIDVKRPKPPFDKIDLAAATKTSTKAKKSKSNSSPSSQKSLDLAQIIKDLADTSYRRDYRGSRTVYKSRQLKALEKVARRGQAPMKLMPHVIEAMCLNYRDQGYQKRVLTLGSTILSAQGPKVIDEILDKLKGLNSGNRYGRQSAAVTFEELIIEMGKKDPQKVLPLILKAMQKNYKKKYDQYNRTLERYIFSATVRIGSPSVPYLVRFSRDSYWRMRQFCAQALGYIGKREKDKKVLYHLKRLSKDDHPRVSIQAIESIGMLGKEAVGAIKNLINLMRSKGKSDRYGDEKARKAEEVLKKIGPPVIPFLKSSLATPDDKFKLRVISLLSDFGPQARTALSRLKSMLAQEQRKGKNRRLIWALKNAIKSIREIR